MGLFGGGRDKDLRKHGTRVPAALVKIDMPFARDAARAKYTMHWEAQTPEGGSIPFTVKAQWCPPEGIYLEAACDEARENAVLVLDVEKMPREMSKHGAAVVDSEDAAAVLCGGEPGGGLMRAAMQKYGLAANLRQLKR